MLFWALDNPAPCNYLLICGDRDFSNALHQLRMRKYNILLAQPQKASISLVAAAKCVWQWTSLLAGGRPLTNTDGSVDNSVHAPVSEPLLMPDNVYASTTVSINIADEHDIGENEGEDATLTETRRIIKQEVAKALVATLPTYMEGMQVSLRGLLHDELTTFRVENGRTGENVEAVTKKVSYEEFMACKPSEFKGEVNPLLSKRWIYDIEGTFEISHCDSADKVIFAANQLKERAKDWWEILCYEKGREGIKNLTWAEFKELFLERFSTLDAIDQIKEEFSSMKQKDESIDVITALFFEKAKFCPDLLQTESKWIYRYMSMLNGNYSWAFMPSKCETLSEVIEWARERELELKRKKEQGERTINVWKI